MNLKLNKIKGVYLIKSTKMNQDNNNNNNQEFDEKKLLKKQKDEWWTQIRELPDARRSRALTYRCKECGKGSLQGVKTTFPNGDVEAICEDCK